MTRFNYKAKKGPKEIISGILEAGTEKSALEKLEQMGYVPVSVVVVEQGSKGPVSPASTAFSGAKRPGMFSKIRSKDLTIFTEQLAGLVKSKLPILEAVDILFEQTESPALKEIISNIRQEIKDGSTLSESLGRYPGTFSVLYVNMVRSGESGGVLEQTLLRLADFRNKQEEIKAGVSSALAYPIFIIMVGTITVFALLAFVIPRLTSLFEEMGQVLPLSTRILMMLSSRIKSYWYWGVLAVLAVVFMLRRRGTKGKEKMMFDRLKLKLPLLGDFIKKSTLAAFSRTFGILLANGIPVFQALEISIPTVDNEVFRSELRKVCHGVVDGVSLEQSMKRSDLFPRFMTNMLAVGERGGNLKEALLDVADFYERQLNKAVKVMTSLLEPIIILAVGLVVGFIVFAMLMPIFSINIAG
ncbi:MAG: type II secretion system F family protein [Candidatus Omnitrophota bacterium]|nr:type II secretion system F family protein [Candidatus Omnitrophota bacterium]